MSLPLQKYATMVRNRTAQKNGAWYSLERCHTKFSDNSSTGQKVFRNELMNTTSYQIQTEWYKLTAQLKHGSLSAICIYTRCSTSGASLKAVTHGATRSHLRMSGPGRCLVAALCQQTPRQKLLYWGISHQWASPLVQNGLTPQNKTNGVKICISGNTFALHGLVLKFWRFMKNALTL